MKIAISTDSGKVSAHFGRCPEFTIVEIDNGKVKSKEVIGNPGHHPGYIPEFLHQRGVSCIIAGGMGMRAQGFFSEYGIQTIVGVSGTIDETIQKLLDGKLVGNRSLCVPGSGKGYGIEKTECDHPNDKGE